MEKYRVERDGQTDLQFTGVCLADASNRAVDGPASNRWTEIRIYRTEAGRYVTSVVGVSCWQGETNRYTADVCDNAADVVIALEQDGWLSGVAKDVLAQAAQTDDAFRDVIVETVE